MFLSANMISRGGNIDMVVIRAVRREIQKRWQHVITRSRFWTQPRDGARALFVLSALAIFALPFQAGAAEPASKLYLAAKVQSQAPSGARQLCARYSWACAASGNRDQITRQHFGVANQVNRQINKTTNSVSDMRQYQSEDLWALPTRRGGDCEDFALLKKRELVRLGFPAQRLLLATAIDSNRGPHAVLVMRTDEGDFVLDNLRNEILPWSSTRYTFVRMQNPASPRNWVGVFAKG